MQTIFTLDFRAQMESCQLTNQKENNLTQQMYSHKEES